MNWKADVIDIGDEFGAVGRVENRGDHMVLRFGSPEAAKEAHAELERNAYEVSVTNSRILCVYAGDNDPRKNEGVIKTTIGEIKALIAEAGAVMEHKDLVSSIKKQFGRARNEEDLRHIVDAYDSIIGALMMPELRQDEWASKQDPFTKWHFRQARQEMNVGTLNLDDLPSGDVLYAAEERRREEAHAISNASGVHRIKTPEERAHDQKMAVYGGEENYRKGVGLGT